MRREETPIVIIPRDAITSERGEFESRNVRLVEKLNIPLQCQGCQLLFLCSGPHLRSISSASATRPGTSSRAADTNRLEFGVDEVVSHAEWQYASAAPGTGRELVVARHFVLL